MNEHPIILVAEDDAADILLLKTAARKAELVSEIRVVADGVELLDYLTGEGAYQAAGSAPRPYLVVLDLNMPRMDGKRALREMRVTAESRTLPIVVMSTTDRREEIDACLALGANSFIVKPMGVGPLVSALRLLEDYWLNTVAPG